MKKNKEHRVFSRVLSRLAWATFYHVCEENDKAYKEVLAAKRLIEDFGGEEVEVVFYDREYHILFTLYRYREHLNRYYTVSASHGYENDYHITNLDKMRKLISASEFARDCTLSRDYRDYQAFRQYANGVLMWALEPGEFAAYCSNGNIVDIPYDIATRLWRDLHSCTEKIANEAIAHKKVVL